MAAPMEQYLLLAKRAKGRALVDLIQKATAEPGIYAFAELLDVPNVKEVLPMPWRRCQVRTARHIA